MSKKAKKSNNPFFNLASEQFEELNDEFYKNYNKDYYSIKLDSLLKMIESSESYCKGSNMKVGILEYERSFEEEEILKYAKTELAVTVFHCLESFLRLYMAHCSMRGCPWLDLADMTLTKYNNNIQKLKKQVYNIFNLSDFTDDEIITAVFYGSKSVPAEIIDKTNLTEKEIVERFKRYIQFAVTYLDNRQDYNSYKHGLQITQKENGFSYGGTRGTNEILSVHGDSLTYLQVKKDDKNNKRWVKTTKWIDYKQQATLIFFFNLLIADIIDIWSPDREKYLKTFPIVVTIEELLENRENYVGGKIGREIEGFQVTEMSRGLLYYEND